MADTLCSLVGSFASVPHGRFHVWLPDGQWTLRFSLQDHEGISYAPETVTVNVVQGQTVELNVQLLEEEKQPAQAKETKALP